MINRCKALKESGVALASFDVGELRITYPGKKELGDYRLSERNHVIRHDEVAQRLHDHAVVTDADELIDALEDLYRYGLKSQHPGLPQELKTLIYWITLQEDINYPPARGYYGKKLSFQRFYEAILAQLGFVTLEDVKKRTNKRGEKCPPLLDIARRKHPSFYH